MKEGSKVVARGLDDWFKTSTKYPRGGTYLSSQANPALSKLLTDANVELDNLQIKQKQLNRAGQSASINSLLVHMQR